MCASNVTNNVTKQNMNAMASMFSAYHFKPCIDKKNGKL